MIEHILIGSKSTDKMVRGVSKYAQIVGETLGADGKHVFAEHPTAKIPIETKDGARVGGWIQFSDRFENMGAGIVRFAADKTAIEAGDGTTTTTIIAAYIIRKGIKKINHGFNVRKIFSLIKNGLLGRRINHGFNARKISIGIEQARDVLVDFLNDEAIVIDSKSDLVERVAMVSSNYDQEIAKLITGVIGKAGKNAVIKVDSALDTKSKIEYVDGMEISTSYAHPVFINNNHNECVLENVAIVVCDYEVSKITEIARVFELIENNKGKGKPAGILRNLEDPDSYRKVDSYLFIAKEVQGAALSSLAKSKKEHNAPVAIAKAPRGDDFHELIRDIAISTGGKVIAENEGFNMEKMNPHTDCGWAKKIVLSATSLVIIEGECNAQELSNRLMRLSHLEQNAPDPHTKKVYRERSARLTGSVARLIVGGENDAAIKARRDRAEDATHAVRSALEEGITAGGGITFLRAVKALDVIQSTDPEIMEGVHIVRDALLVPLITMLTNSGYDDGEITRMIKKIQSNNDLNVGYNTLTNKIENLLEAGIIDPVKVLRCSIENSCNVAVQFLNTGAALYFLPQNNDQ